MTVEPTDLLVHWQFWILELQFLALLATTAIELPKLRVDRGCFVSGLALGAMTLAVVATVPPRTNRIYYDEHIYQSIGRSFADEHAAQMCNDGVVEYGRLQCREGVYNKQPHAYPYLLSVLYRIAGVSEVAAFRLNNVVTGLTVAVTVWIAALLYGDLRVALLAGGIFAMLPMALQWGNTAAAEPAAVLFAAATVLAALQYTRARTGTALAWLIALGAFAVSVRPESPLVIFVAMIAIVLFAPGELRTRRFAMGAIAAAAGAVLPVLHMYAIRHSDWGATGERMSVAFLRTNLPVNLAFYFGDERFPPLFGIAAVLGLLVAGRGKERILLAVYFLLFWGVFLFFYAGSYNYGADVRYSLMSYVPLAVLASAGLLRTALFAKERFLPRLSDRAVLSAVTAIVLIHFAGFLPLIRAVGEEAWAARADVTYAKLFASRLPPNSIVLTHNPTMFHVWGVNAAQISLVKGRPAYVADYLRQRFAGGVFVHWNFWCNIGDPVQSPLCTDALAVFPSDLIEQHQVRDQRFALYRLRP